MLDQFSFYLVKISRNIEYSGTYRKHTEHQMLSFCVVGLHRLATSRRLIVRPRLGKQDKTNHFSESQGLHSPAEQLKLSSLQPASTTKFVELKFRQMYIFKRIASSLRRRHNVTQLKDFKKDSVVCISHICFILELPKKLLRKQIFFG